MVMCVFTCDMFTGWKINVVVKARSVNLRFLEQSESLVGHVRFKLFFSQVALVTRPQLGPKS
jgi:hypothetical protein